MVIGSEGVVSLRDILRLLLLSLLLVLVCANAFRSNAPSRRILLIAGMLALLLLPWLLSSSNATWRVPFEKVPAWQLEAKVPLLLLLTWLFVAASLLLQQLLRVRREVRAVLALPDLHNKRVLAQLNSLVQAMRLPLPQLKQGDRACSLGFAGGVIVLPTQACVWSTDVLRSVLAHELVHIKRRDGFWLLLSHMLQRFYWWMPWLTWLHQYFVRAMEESCDDQASQYLGDPLLYVNGLVNSLRVADAGQPPRTRHGSAILAMHGNHVYSRVRRFGSLRRQQIESGGLYWCMLALLTLVTVLTGIDPVAAENRLLAHHAGNSYWLGTTLDRGAPDRIDMAHVDVSTRPLTPDLPNHPTALFDARVVYPGKALRQRLQGDVLVHFRVNLDGSISHARVAQSQPPQIFDQAAMRAVQQSSFQPFHRSSSVRWLTAAETHTGSGTQTISQPFADTVGQPVWMQRHFSFRLP